MKPQESWDRWERYQRNRVRLAWAVIAVVACAFVGGIVVVYSALVMVQVLGILAGFLGLCWAVFTLMDG